MQNMILLVEDSIEYQKLIQSALSFKYKLDCVDSLALARERFHTKPYNLILLDVLLPDGNGFEFCREIQSQPDVRAQTPVIILTAKNAISDKVVGFTVGADDYVTKPFDPTELLARVDSKIAKAEKKKSSQNIFKRGPFRIEVENMGVYVESPNGTSAKADLTPTEFKLFLKLVQNSNRILSRQQLIDDVWGLNIYIEDRSIDKHISSLRRKIRPFEKFIRTISGVGYEFEM